MKDLAINLIYFETNYSHVPNSRGGHISVLAEKLPKMAILRDKLKNFEKTKRGEAMK